jgi:hypothetical protein
MTNAKRYILGANPYDYLIKIQESLLELTGNRMSCVIEMIAGKPMYCKYRSNCSACLQDWLNEDETKTDYIL